MTKTRDFDSSIDSVRVLVAVADTGSLTSAAARLALTPSAVSKALTRTEARLGVRLVQRTTRRVALTDLGQAYVARGRTLLADLDRLDRETAAEQAGTALRGILRVTAPAVYGALKVAPMLASFQQQHPDLDIQLHCDDRRVDIVAERVDIAVRILPRPPAELVAKVIADDRRGLYASPSYVNRSQLPRTLADLARHPVVGYAGAPKRPWPTGRTVFATDSVLAAKEAALAGLGVVELPEYLAAVDVAAGRLRELLPGALPIARKIFALYLPSRHAPRAIRACVSFLVKG